MCGCYVGPPMRGQKSPRAKDEQNGRVRSEHVISLIQQFMIHSSGTSRKAEGQSCGQLLELIDDRDAVSYKSPGGRPEINCVERRMSGERFLV